MQIDQHLLINLYKNHSVLPFPSNEGDSKEELYFFLYRYLLSLTLLNRLKAL
jgi:hypothetical protein